MKVDLTEGSVKGHLVRMAVPMGWGIFSAIGMNIIDTYFVGQLGTKQLAAMGFTFPFVLFLYSLAWGVASGASSVISRSLGAKNSAGANNYATQALIMALTVAIIFAIAGLATTDIIFPLLGAKADLMPYIHDYIDIWYTGCFMVVVPMVGNSMMRAAGNTKFPSYMMITGAVVNLILSPIMIFGLFGFPRMELEGAALSTVISYAVIFISVLYLLSKKMQMIAWSHCFDRIWQHWRAILHVGIPAMGNNLIGPISVMITTWMVAKYGSEVVAGYGVATRIEALFFVIMYAVTSVMSSIVGQNWGAGRIDRVKEVLTTAYKFSFFWGIVVAILLWFIAEPIISLFDKNTAVIEAAAFYLHIIPITYAFLGLVFVTVNSANGMGTPRPAIIMTFSRLVMIYLPLAFFLDYLWPLQGIYIATALSNIIVGIAALLWSQNKCRTAILD